MEDKTEIDKDTRSTVLWALLGISILGTMLIMFLPAPLNTDGKAIKEDHGSPLQALQKTWKIANTKYMLILFISFVYMGKMKNNTNEDLMS